MTTDDQSMKAPRTRRAAGIEIGIAIAYLLFTLGVTQLVLHWLMSGGRASDSATLVVAQTLWAGMVLPFIVYMLRRSGGSLSSIGLVLPRKQVWREVLIGSGLGLGMKVALIPLGVIAILLGFRPNPPPISLHGFFEMILAILAGSMAAVLEEILFRGYLRRLTAFALGDARKEGGLWPTGVVISLVFGLGHVSQGAMGILLISFVGMMLFMIVSSKRFTLMHCILAHAIFNATSFAALAAM